MAESENKVEQERVPAESPAFGLHMDVVTWVAVHAHLIRGMCWRGGSKDNRARVKAVLQAIGAALVRTGAITVQDLETVYIEHHAIHGGEYYGPAAKLVNANSAD